MKLLLDTHILLWAVGQPERLTPAVHKLLSDQTNDLIFSAVRIWEMAIKARQGRADFEFDATVMRRGLLDQGYAELPINGAHAAAVSSLPALHKDPFDRILIAQSIVEGLLLLTRDSMIARYPAPIRLV